MIAMLRLRMVRLTLGRDFTSENIQVHIMNSA